jgi:hypothetical protein
MSLTSKLSNAVENTTKDFSANDAVAINLAIQDQMYPEKKSTAPNTKIRLVSNFDVARSEFVPSNDRNSIDNSFSVLRQDPQGMNDAKGKPETFTTHHDFKWRRGNLKDQTSGLMRPVYEIETTGLNGLKRKQYIDVALADKYVLDKVNGGKQSGTVIVATNPKVRSLLPRLNQEGSLVVDTTKAKSKDDRIHDQTLSILATTLEIVGNVLGAKQIRTNLSIRKTLLEKQAIGTLTAAEEKQLTLARANLTTITTGAVTGGMNWALFSDKSSFDEAGMSEGGKSALNLLTWTNGAGYLSTFMAGKNIGIAENMLKSKLKNGGGLNWGFFSNPTTWTAAALEKAGLGAAAKTFAPFLEYIATKKPAEWLTQKGAINIADDVIAGWGMKDAAGNSIANKAQLADALVGSKIWRSFINFPIGGTPFVIAQNGGIRSTASSYVQLMLSRGMTSLPANLLFQSVSSLAMNGSLKINWTSAGAAFLGGNVRSLGAPGAWIASTIPDRLKSYGLSSFGSFVTQYLTGQYVNGLQKGASMSHTTVQILGNINQAYNAMVHLSPQIADGRVKLTASQKALLNEYSQRLEAIASEFKNNKGANIDQRATDMGVSLDTWLDTKVEGASIRSKLEAIDFKPTSDAHRQFIESICIKNNIPYRETMKSLGITPGFTSFEHPEVLKKRE